LNGFLAIIGVHKYCVTILRKPFITGFATEQMSFIFAIPRTGCDVSFSPDSMVLTLWIGAKIISKIYHPNLLSVKGFFNCTLKREGYQEKNNNN
jgi:hypothetical protein